ncbi:MAG: hypothetical protein HYS26_02530 [Candidatus Kaiserbacteria bacterium]|nr:MAG: hypothetical protein HYS26_02530 [Candidatus Kaiserbacteria bacterium]
MSILKRIAKYTGYLIAGLIVLAVLFIVTVNVVPDLILGGVSRSHIDANVPSRADFDTFLKRDLTSYFTQKLGTDAEVKYELLRNSPAQSGVAYPKYYIWVVVDSTNSRLEGAIRVAAVEKTSFDVTDFVSKDEIMANPNVLQQIFPQDVISKIQGYIDYREMGIRNGDKSN